MSSELDQRLEAMFADAPEPDPGAGEEALHRALRSLHPVTTPRRGMRAAVLAFATAVVLLVIAAGSLGAAGALHVSLGTQPKRPPATTQLAPPLGEHGITAIVNGRLSVAIKGGIRLQGWQVTAATLSPHARFVAAGIRHSLVAIAPDGSRPWTHAVGGEVVAIAWAPDGIRIAYVVRTRSRLVLHVIWGDGTNDEVIDRSVRALQPSWRADSLAFAYVGAGGKPIVYDLGHRRHTVLGSAAPVTRVAFAPVGKTLLVATPGAAILDGKTIARGGIEAIGWLHGGPAVALEAGVTEPVIRTYRRAGRPIGSFRVPGRVVGITHGLVVTRTRDRILAGWRAKTVSTLLEVRQATPVADIEIG